MFKALLRFLLDIIAVIFMFAYLILCFIIIGVICEAFHLGSIGFSLILSGSTGSCIEGWNAIEKYFNTLKYKLCSKF